MTKPHLIGGPDRAFSTGKNDFLVSTVNSASTFNLFEHRSDSRVLVPWLYFRLRCRCQPPQSFYMTDCLSSKVSPDKALAPTGNRLGLGQGFQRFIQTLKLPWMRAFGPIGIPTS